MRLFLSLFIISLIWAQSPKLHVLGVTQDGGFPHLGCNKDHCKIAWKDPSKRKMVVALAVSDPIAKKWYLFEATPDIKWQLNLFQTQTNGEYHYLPDGIFITHAHIGHYTGLMELGFEVMGAKDVPVYAQTRMIDYLKRNGPWSQLVSMKNIQPHVLNPDQPLRLTDQVRVTAFPVPHRDEYSETSGFRISIAEKDILFIPDINKWSIWKRSIVDEVRRSHMAFLDASFYKDGEIKGRSMADIPHPFVEETMRLFKEESRSIRQKVVFIHFNHTNPVLWDAQVRTFVLNQGFAIATQGMVIGF